jgi:hypothetical protein
MVRAFHHPGPFAIPWLSWRFGCPRRDSLAATRGRRTTCRCHTPEARTANIGVINYEVHLWHLTGDYESIKWTNWSSEAIAFWALTPRR